LKRISAALSVLLTATMVLGACTMGKREGASPSPSPTGTETASPPAASKVTGTTFENWGSYGYDLKNQRHAPFNDINVDNVKDLGVIWSADLKTLDPDVKNGNQCYPVVVDGVLYITTSGNQVFAFDSVTGNVLWHWKPPAEQVANYSKAGVIANRGVAVGEGKVFMLTVDNHLVALDQKTGELVKMIALSDYIEGVTLENGYYETTVPQYYNGKVYIGSSGSDNGVRGFVHAFKASDLTPAWDEPFWTVPPKGQDWLANSAYNGGGAVWNPVAIDEEEGIVYAAVGNSAPDFYDEKRPGANPHTASVVALDAETGKLIWSGVEVAHDVWDYDAAASPMIITATVKGEKRKVVVQGGKNGKWYAWDAKTGEVIHDGIPFNKQDQKRPTPEGTVSYPGVLGGENYAPETYDPANNLVLIPGIEQPTLFKSARTEEEAYTPDFPGAMVFGTSIDTPQGAENYGTITAINLDTGEKVYHNKTKQPMRGGLTSTAGGVTFYGELDGTINAINTKTGELIWTFQTTGTNIQAAPALFKVDGKPYMAFTSGGTDPKVFVFGLGGDKTQGKPPQEADTGSAHQQ